MKRALAAALTAALACAALTLLYSVASAQSETGVWIYGGPGSVTVNGEPAPPGTQLLVGVGRNGEEIVSGERVQPDGSWWIHLLHSWERVYLNVDGFLVPGGPFDVEALGAKGTMRLDVGVETDPEPYFVIIHARSEDITLFGEPAPDGAELGVIKDGEFYVAGLLTAGRDWDHSYSPGTELSFAINGFPVAGEPIRVDPADAPIWITLHAGDPEHPPFRFYGPPGDIVDRRSLCWVDPLPPLEIIAYRDDGWERIVPVQPNGSWELEAPSGMTDFRFVVASPSRWELKAPSGTTDIRPFIASTSRWLTLQPTAGPRYDATAATGSQIVPLNYTHQLWYQFRGDLSAFLDETAPATETWVEARRGRTIIEEIWVWPGRENYQISVPYGTLGVSLWVNGQLADRRLHNAVLGELEPETGSRCAKRVDLKPQAAAAPTPPASLWTLEWLLLQARVSLRSNPG